MNSKQLGKTGLIKKYTLKSNIPKYILFFLIQRDLNVFIRVLTFLYHISIIFFCVAIERIEMTLLQWLGASIFQPKIA